MNITQKKSLDSNVEIIKEAAYELAVYEVLYGSEPFDTLQDILQKDAVLVRQKVTSVLKQFAKEQMFLQRYREIFLKISPNDANFVLLLSVYEQTRKGTRKKMLLGDIKAYQLEEIIKFRCLYENMGKDEDLRKEVEIMIPRLGFKVNALLNNLIKMPMDILEKVSEFADPDKIGSILGCFDRPEVKNAERAKPIIEKLVLGRKAIYIGQHFSTLTSILFQCQSFDLEWRFSMILKMIEGAVLSGKQWEIWREKIAELFSELLKSENSLKADGFWDKLEHCLNKLSKIKYGSHLLNIIRLADAIAKRAAESKDPEFLWVAKPLNEYSKFITAILKFELSMIKALMDSKEAEKTGEMPQITGFLIKFNSGKTLNEKKNRILDVIKTHKNLSFKMQDFDVYTTQLADCMQSAQTKNNVIFLFEKLVVNNGDWFNSGGKPQMEHIESLHVFCEKHCLKIPTFDKFYRYEYFFMQEDLRNQEEIIEALKLPKPM